MSRHPLLLAAASVALAVACLDFDGPARQLCLDHPVRCGETADGGDAGEDRPPDAGLDGGVGDGGSDAGMDAGVPCTYGSCPTGFVCSYPEQRCTHAQDCLAPPAAVQPGGCPHGQYCLPSSVCTDVKPPSCDAFGGGHPSTWTPLSEGAVIYSFTPVSIETDVVLCALGGTVRATARVEAYRADGGPWGSVAAVEQALHSVSPDGQEETSFFVGDLQTSNAGKHATFTVNICLPIGTTAHAFAVHFLDGNGACASLPPP